MTTTRPLPDYSEAAHQKERLAYWNEIARKTGNDAPFPNGYHRQLLKNYQFLVAPGQRVLEIGCGRGDLLAALNPSVGVGVDFSQEMIRIAETRYPNLRFVLADSHELALDEKFDIIILSDLINDQWDVQKVFNRLRILSTPRTRIIMNFYSRVWELPLNVAGKLGLANPTLYQNWLTIDDVVNLLSLAGFEIIRSWQEILWPLRTPVIDTLMNRFVGRLWPFNLLGLTNFVLARPQPDRSATRDEPIVSVVVPARNEAGNIAQIFARTPEMGRKTELIFVEGHSKDDTYAEIERQITAHPERHAKLFRQTGAGKGDAVRLGYANATGDVLMILDADMTVPPEDLPRFYEALRDGNGDFINGVRLVYPMEKQAMRFFNFLANKFFSWAFSWLLGQSVKDTLCGTKVLWKTDYERIAANRSYFGDFDPFGDFDLLFGAAKLNQKIVDMPIRYRERTYGTTNIQRWKHGWLLLRMVAFAARRLKFT
jgi:SAM-dependent methyltransferase